MKKMLIIFLSITLCIGSLTAQSIDGNYNIDRLVAILNTLFVCVSIYYISYIEKAIFCIALINGLYLLDKSRLHRKNENIELYSYYHTMWHLTFPLYLLIWLSYRNIMFVSNE